MMFWQTYKNTFKNIFRSPLFWLILVTVIGMIFYTNTQAMFGNDTDSEFVYEWGTYIRMITQGIYPILLDYLIPVFVIVTTFLVVSRDYGDEFYEIEKARGVSPSTYFFGRIAALFTLNGVALIIFGMMRFHLYTFTRGMVEGMSLNEYLVDSTERLLRVIFYGGIPCVLFYITLTYVLGSLFRSWVISAVGSIGYMTIYYLITVNFRAYLPEWVDNYAPPIPDKVLQYLYYYDTRRFMDFINFYRATLPYVTIAFCITLGCSVVFMTVSYLCTWRRTK